MGLGVLEPESGQVVADLTASSGYVAAILSKLVGPSGAVHAIHAKPEDPTLHQVLSSFTNVTITTRPLDRILYVPDGAERIWIGAALPWVPKALAEQLPPSGRLVAAVGPRFRRQDLVSLTATPSGPLMGAEMVSR